MDSLHVRFRSTASARGSGPGHALDVELDLPRYGITALCGPSGSGKTTCLRVIAGLERIAGARVSLGDETWQDEEHFVPVHRRALGYVFQEASLFSHLTVRANLEFGLRRVAPRERRFALEPVAALLAIGGLLGRRPDHLSGGERQRVAIARALLASPRLLLMDEPLAALDHGRKQELLPYLERLRDELSIPILYVTHSADEVRRLADHLVLLDQGAVRASGPLAQVLGQAGLPGILPHDASGAIETVLAAHEADGLSRLDFAGGALLVARRPEPVGTRMRCAIRIGDVSLLTVAPGAGSVLNTFAAEVTALAVSDLAGHALVHLRIGATALQALVTLRAARALDIVPGRRLLAQVHAVTPLI